MKIKCPTCGATGTDVEPVTEDMRGPSWTPQKGEEDYAFAVHGRQGGRAVRKCLNCGSGVYVKLLPPRYQAIPADRWAQMEVYFAEEMAAQEAHMNELSAQWERERDAEA